SSLWRDPPSSWMQRPPLGVVLGAQQRMMDWLHLRYDRLLRWSLRHRIAVLAIAFATLAGAFGLLASGLVKSEFVPRVDEGWTSLRIQTPVGSSLAYTVTKAEQVEATLREFPEIEHISKSVW